MQGCYELHHEIELGAIVGKRCKMIKESEAMSYVGRYSDWYLDQNSAPKSLLYEQLWAM